MYTTRFVAGMDIGGEYAAIGAAIEETIPGRYRRQVDIAINGTCWGGALLGTLAELVIINRLPDTVSWRIGFLLGPALAIAVLYVQRNPPANLRWFVIHGKLKEAKGAIRRMKIEAGEHGKLPLLTESNALIFTCALVLASVYHVKSGPIPFYFLAFAIGHLVGLLVLARLFDTTGRWVMISSTYLSSGLLLALTAWAFDANLLSAFSQAICLSAIIFCASAGAALIVLGASAELAFGVAAKRLSPEELARPLSCAVT
ncbi:MAG: MFS transporter, partial [Acidimicrobiales bacterium]